MSIGDVNRYNELAGALNKPQIDIRAGDSNKLEKVFYGIYLQKDKEAINKFRGTLDSLVRGSKQHTEENKKLSELQSKVQAVFEEKEPEAVRELKRVSEEAYKFAQEIANKTFSPEELFPLIQTLNNVPPSLFGQNHLAVSLKETCLALLLEQVPLLRKTDDLFRFLASFSDVQLEEMAQKYILRGDLEKKEKIASFLQKIIMNAKKSPIKKAERDLASIRLFCTFVVPLCQEENYVNKLFADRTSKEQEAMVEMFRDVKKNPPTAFNPLPLARDQLVQIANKIADPETFFVKLLQEIADKHDQQVATGKKTALIPLPEFIIGADKKGTLQKHVRVLLGQKPTIVLKVAEEAGVLAKPELPAEAANITPKEKVKKRRCSIITNVSQRPKKIEKVTAVSSQVTSLEEVTEIVPMEVQEGPEKGAELRPQVHVKRHIWLQKVKLEEIFKGKINALPASEQPLVRKFLSLDLPLSKQEIGTGFDFVMNNAAIPPEFLPFLSDLKTFLQDPKIDVGLVKLFLADFFSLLQQPTIMALNKLSRLFGAILLLRDHQKAALQSIDYSNPLVAEQKIYDAAHQFLTGVCEKSHPEKTARPEQNVAGQLLVNPKNKAAFDVYGTYYQNQYAAHVADLLQDSDGQINRYLGHEELECLFPGASEFNLHAKETYTLFKRTDLLNEILQEKAQPPEPGNIAGDWTVRSTLHLDEKVPITKKHVRQTIFATTLSHWSQQYYGSCSTTATYLLLEAVSLKWICEDFVEIIEKGKLSREVNGRTYDFFTLVKTTPWLEGFYIGQAPLSDDKISNICETLFSFKDIQHAFSVSGIEKSDFKSLVQLLANKKQAVTFNAILAERKTQLEAEKIAPAANQKLIQEKLDALEKNINYVRFLIGSTFEISLIRLWENSAMNLTAPPMQEFVEGNETGKLMSMTISKAFLEVGKKVAEKLSNGSPDEKALAEDLRKAIESVPRGLKTLKGPINFNENVAERELPRGGLRARQQKVEIVQDARKVAIEKVKVSRADFSEPMIDVLSRFRFALGPSSDPNDHDIHCMLCVKKDEKFVRIENEKQFKECLESAFYDLVNNVYKPVLVEAAPAPVVAMEVEPKGLPIEEVLKPEPIKPFLPQLPAAPVPSPQEPARFGWIWNWMPFLKPAGQPPEQVQPMQVEKQAIPPVPVQPKIVETKKEVPKLTPQEIVSHVLPSEELVGHFKSWFTTFFSSSNSYRVGKLKSGDAPWDFACEGIGAAEIFTAATSRIAKKAQQWEAKSYNLIENGRLSPSILEYAQKVGGQLSYDKDVVVNVASCEHGFRFYPNRSLSVPKGMSYETWIAEEENKFFSLALADFPQTREQIKGWAKARASKESWKDIEASIDKLLSYKQIKLSDFINGVREKISDKVQQKEAIEDLNKSFHFYYLQGRRLDKKNDWNDGILYFGDPQWKTDVQKKTIPYEYLLYFNPLEKHWDFLAYAADLYPIFEEANKQHIISVDTFEQAQVLKEPMEQKRLCLLTDDIHARMEKIGETFLLNFEALEEKLKVDGHVVQNVQNLFSEAISIKAAKDALKDLKPKIEIPDDVIKILLTLIEQKEKQQAIIDEICSIQNPVVDQLSDALFITGFQPQTPKFEALKGDFEDFRGKIYDLCASNPQAAIAQPQSASRMEE